MFFGSQIYRSFLILTNNIDINGLKIILMAHWTDYTTRGWLTFLSFMHIGTAFRCFLDRDFLRTKIFTNLNQNDQLFGHVFGVYSIINAFILIQSAIYLYVYPLTRLVICAILAYLGFFLAETFIYKTIHLFGSSIFPVALSGLTLLWVITFHYIWKPWQNRRDLSELESEAFLKYGLPANKNARRRYRE